MVTIKLSKNDPRCSYPKDHHKEAIESLRYKLQQKEKVIEVLKSACEFYRDYENDIKDQGYDLDCRAGGALKQIEDLTQKEK